MVFPHAAIFVVEDGLANIIEVDILDLSNTLFYTADGSASLCVFRVFLCVIMCDHVYSCVRMCSYMFVCVRICSCVFVCVLVCSRVFMCFRVWSCVFLCS